MKKQEAFFRLAAQGLGCGAAIYMVITLKEAWTFSGLDIAWGLREVPPVMAIEAGIALALLAVLAGLDALITRTRLPRALRRTARSLGVGVVKGLVFYAVLAGISVLIYD